MTFIHRFFLLSAIIYALVSCAKSNQDKNPTPKPPAVKPTAEGLKFEDPNLEACIKSTQVGTKKDGTRVYADINEDSVISLDEAGLVKEMYCRGNHIVSLDGIEVFENLEYIDCSANELGNMPKFSKLKNLKTLKCSNNYFTDSDCTEFDLILKNGLSHLDITQQRDGRVLTCDQVKLVGHIPVSGPRYENGRPMNRPNDVWGFVQNKKEYAVYGTTANIHIVELNENEPPYFRLVATMDRGKKGAKLRTQPNHSTWAELRYFSKGGKGYLYVSSEGDSNYYKKNNDLPYLQLFDVTDIENPVEIKIQNIHEGLRSIHNITLDQDRELLWAFGGTNHNGKKDEKGRSPRWEGARVYSITDPTNPKYIMTVGDLYVHDGQIKTTQLADGSYKTMFYAAHGSGALHTDSNKNTNEKNRIRIYEVIGLAAEKVKTVMDMQYEFGYAHNVWVTEEDNHIIVTGETSVDNQLSYWELIKQDNGTLKAEFRNGLNFQGASFSHNAFVLGKHIYASHYTKGVQVSEIYVDDSGKQKIRLKWAYDSYPQHNKGVFAGSWGVFPFTTLNSTLFMSTDGDTGFYIFKKFKTFHSEEKSPIE